MSESASGGIVEPPAVPSCTREDHRRSARRAGTVGAPATCPPIQIGRRGSRARVASAVRRSGSAAGHRRIARRQPLMTSTTRRVVGAGSPSSRCRHEGRVLSATAPARTERNATARTRRSSRTASPLPRQLAWSGAIIRPSHRAVAAAIAPIAIHGSTVGRFSRYSRRSQRKTPSQPRLRPCRERHQQVDVGEDIGVRNAERLRLTPAFARARTCAPCSRPSRPAAAAR